jgi:regulator of sirC expression with transglutaminase-like and TPR domain
MVITLSRPLVMSLSYSHQGDEDIYYHPSNSLLNCVLSQRHGIPLSLALIHMAVGRAVGLRVQLLGVPGHVVNVMRGGGNGEEGEEEDVVVDVFNGGKLMTR